MTLADDITIKQIGVSFSLILGGGIIVYLLTQQQKNSTRRQVQALKNEVIMLRSLLNESVKELTREIETIRLSLRKGTSGLYRNASNATLHSVDSFTSACDDLTDNHSRGDGIQNESGGGLRVYRGGGGGDGDKSYLEFDLLCQRSDQLHLGNDQDREEALRLLQDHEPYYEDEWELLWRLSRAHVSVYDLRDSNEERHLHAQSAVDYSQRALILCDNSSNVYKWLAISLGVITEFQPTRQKIETGWALRDHIDRAIELNSDDAILRFIRGRWFYGVCQLTWIERKLAATLFAEPPSAKIEQALEEFRCAEELAPKTNKANQLYLAKCKYEMGDLDDAVVWARHALDMPCNNKDDRDTHRQCQALIKRLDRR